MGFWTYYRRFLSVFFRDWLKLAGQQVVVGLLLAGMTLALQIHYGLISQAGLSENLKILLYPYAAILGLFVLWHLIRTPWKMHDELERDAQRLRVEQTAEPIRALGTELLELSGAIYDYLFEEAVTVSRDTADEQSDERNAKRQLLDTRFDRRFGTKAQQALERLEALGRKTPFQVRATSRDTRLAKYLGTAGRFLLAGDLAALIKITTEDMFWWQ